ncbi:MAG: Tim44 domain-containing protein [Labilithrix sp.]|nr:Tim44 domain-containing protein [Labilithrix sp.]
MRSPRLFDPKRLRRLAPVAIAGALVAVAIVLVAVSAAARPGGGSSYSGGGSGGGGGGGGSDGGGDAGALFELLFILCIEHPAIGIPLTLIVIGFFIFKKMAGGKQRDWSSGGASSPAAQAARYVAAVRTSVRLDVIRGVDRNFSRVVFEDFVYSLYAEVHRARGAGALNRLSAYLSPGAAAALQHGTRGPVDGVIVGAMRVLQASATTQSGARVSLEFESNYTEAGRGCYVVERWALVRGPSAKSRTPDRVRVLGCPNCGAPQEQLFSGTCKHCQRVVNDGSFDWTVESTQVVRREERPPIVGSSAEEQGTDDPTIRDRNLPQAIAALRAKDPSFDVAQFQARVGLVFQQFQPAWSGRNLAPMRPFLSDALFTTQQYWVAAYVAQRMRNVTDGARITNLELVKVESDAFYDAITVRLFATGLDYTVTDDGRHVSGSRTKQRAYSEYWTLIRGTHRKGPTRTDLACSNCGAPLAVNMVGQCTYCKVKVTTGDFDWVLSRIEQDESYTG